MIDRLADVFSEARNSAVCPALVLIRQTMAQPHMVNGIPLAASGLCQS